MQEYDSLYNEAHDLLWGEHYSLHMWNGVMFKAKLSWDPQGATLDEVLIDKDKCLEWEMYFWADAYMQEYYSLPEELENALRNTDQFEEYASRIINVESRIKEAFPVKEKRELYYKLMAHLESDPDNNKKDFHESLPT